VLDYSNPPFARWFVGGGMTSLVYNRAKFNAVETNVDSLRATPIGNVKLRARGDSPGVERRRRVSA